MRENILGLCTGPLTEADCIQPEKMVVLGQPHWVWIMQSHKIAIIHKFTFLIQNCELYKNLD